MHLACVCVCVFFFFFFNFFFNFYDYCFLLFIVTLFKCVLAVLVEINKVEMFDTLIMFFVLVNLTQVVKTSWDGFPILDDNFILAIGRLNYTVGRFKFAFNPLYYYVAKLNSDTSLPHRD